FPRQTGWGRPVVVHTKELGPTAGRGQQHRGIGLLTEVLGRFRMLDKYDTSSLQAAVLRALVGFFVRSPFDAEQVQLSMSGSADADPDLLRAEQQQVSFYQQLRNDTRDANPLLMGGVRIPTLAPGESIEAVSAGSQANEFEIFEHTVLRSIAAAT